MANDAQLPVVWRSITWRLEGTDPPPTGPVATPTPRVLLPGTVSLPLGFTLNTNFRTDGLNVQVLRNNQVVFESTTPYENIVKSGLEWLFFLSGF